MESSHRMMFLPILERELRVRARSRANYWVRPSVGLIGILVAVPPLLWAGPFGTPAMMGKTAFGSMIAAAFLLCCAACLVTADAISGERREGTLGLLFLTRVRTLDVLAGKFASNGLTCLLALVALLPVLMLPVLAGGVTSGEVARKSLVLLEVLLLALSAGLWGSATNLAPGRSGRTAMFLLAAVIIVPGAISLFLPKVGVELLSPLGTMVRAGDTAYKTSPARYWTSITLVAAVTSGVLIATVLALHKSLVCDEESATSTSSSSRTIGAAAGSQPKPPPLIRKCAYCGHNNDVALMYCVECGTPRLWVAPEPYTTLKLAAQPTPLHWLLLRKRSLLPTLWLAAAVGFLHYGLFGLVGRLAFPGFFFGVSRTLGFIFSSLTAAVFALAAGRFFVEARRSGELELLLTTPVGAAGIATAQWDHLKRLLVGPVLVMLLPSIGQALLMIPFGVNYLMAGNHDWYRFYYTASLILGGLNVVFGVQAICWTGIWFGWRMGTIGRVVLWTVALTKALPSALSLLAWTLGTFIGSFGGAFGRGWSATRMLAGSFLPQLLTLLFYLLLIRVARTQLRRELAGSEPLTLLQAFTNNITIGWLRLRRWP